MGFFQRRRARRRLEEQLEAIEKYEDLPIEEAAKEPPSEEKQESSKLLDRCEQIMENARQIDDGKKEYRVITAYLNDIEIIENLASDRQDEIRRAAEKMTALNKTRDEFLNTSKKMSDAQFQMLQLHEEEIPDEVLRLRDNEEYQAKVKRDMQYLEGEKQAIKDQKVQWNRERGLLQRISHILLGAVVTLTVLLLVLSLGFNVDVTYAWIVVIAAAFLSAAYLLIRLQSIDRDTRQADVNINYAISLLNKVKIRYVSITNAVDYACDKFHVKNSRELSYQWDLYQETVREQERYRKTNEDLNYYYDRMVGLLRALGLYDSRVWLEQPQALVDSREMVEIKHNLLVRRKKLRSRISYNLDTVKKERREILGIMKKQKNRDPHLIEMLHEVDVMSGLAEQK